MSGVYVTKLPFAFIDLGIEKGRIAAGSGGPIQQAIIFAVSSASDAPWLPARLRSEACTTNMIRVAAMPLLATSAKAIPMRPLSRCGEVIVVPTYAARGQAHPEELDGRGVGIVFRKQTHLDFGGKQQFCWGWFVWRVRPSRVLCMPEATVFRGAGRGKAASLVRRGESGSRFRRLLSYSTGSEVAFAITLLPIEIGMIQYRCALTGRGNQRSEHREGDKLSCFGIDVHGGHCVLIQSQIELVVGRWIDR
jgi:hypothetical protein